MRKKRIYTVAAVCLLVFLYMMIFLLSSDVAEDSSMKSSAVSEVHRGDEGRLPLVDESGFDGVLELFPEE